MVARPFLRSGVRAIGVLLGATLALALFPSAAGELGRLALIVICYALVIQLNRVLREYLSGRPHRRDHMVSAHPGGRR